MDFVLKGFGKLSVEMSPSAPVLVSRTMEYITDHSKKFVFIVMDGMSEFDWRIISKSFADIHYEKGQSMAMIPTVTSISRQCLLSNKFPKELENPWSQSKEKKEFIECAKSLGFTEAQIGYERGYDADFGAAVKCAAIIINDVDDMVHGQLQGRLGMYNDIKVLADQHRLVDTVRRMLAQGFDVYISADHGNTPCTGMGKLMKTGVETETKSRRMIVLKDFANKDSLFEKYENLIEYPGYYLDKQFDYLICGVGESFDAKGDSIEKLVSTLKNIEVLENVKAGVYKVKKHRVANSEIVNLLLLTMMRVDDAGYYSFVELQDSIYLFPFEYTVSKEALLMDGRFSLGSFGGELSVSVKE